MWRRKLPSPRLSPLHGRPSTHLGAAGRAVRGFAGIERRSSDRRVLPPRGRRGFCVAWPAISAPQSPVNKFTVLTVEDPNTIDSELTDALPPNPPLLAPLHKPKWKKRLPKLLSISALDVQGTSLLLPVEIGTTDTSELHSIKALLDCRATRCNIRSRGKWREKWRKEGPRCNRNKQDSEKKREELVILLDMC